jgi:hypothetical protein
MGFAAWECLVNDFFGSASDMKQMPRVNPLKLKPFFAIFDLKGTVS